MQTDPSPQEPRASTGLALHAAWLILLVLLATIVWVGQGWSWRLATGVPWLAGEILLIAPRTRSRVAATSAATFASDGSRISGVIIGATLVLLAWGLSLMALPAFLVWSSAALLGLCSIASARTVRSLVQGSAVVLVTSAVGAVIGELVLRQPAIAYQFGLPSEQRRIIASYDTVEQHNVFSFRSPHERIERTPGVRRIIGLGDSFTWGDHIASTDSTWPSQLERTLNAQAPGAGSVEVINMAHRGYTTVNEVDVLNRIGWQFNPDLVVLQWLVNDVDPSSSDFRHVLPWPPVPSLLPSSFRSGAIASSNLFGFLGQRYAVWKLGTRHRDYPVMYVDSNPAWLANKAAFRELGDSARARKTPVVVMLWPEIGDSVWPPERHPFRSVHAMVTAVARESGLRVLDLTPAFAAAGSDGRRWWVTPYDRHPNAAANRLVAQALHDYLIAERLVDAAPAGNAKH